MTPINLPHPRTPKLQWHDDRTLCDGDSVVMTFDNPVPKADQWNIIWLVQGSLKAGYRFAMADARQLFSGAI